jgi:hypothetical protein
MAGASKRGAAKSRGGAKKREIPAIRFAAI